MKSDIITAEEFVPIGLANVPTGEFRGIWSGYEVKAEISGKHYRFKTKNGIRCIKCSCIICVTEDSIMVETIDNDNIQS